MLIYVIERLRSAGLDEAITCTSEEAPDDPVAALCAEHGLPCFRGPLDDVAARMLAAAREAGADAFVRLSGDSPLLDPALVDQAVGIMRSREPDMVTNVWPIRSFPKGQSVEVIRTETFARACAAMTSAEDREHVTPWLYRNADGLRIESFAAGEDHSSVQLSVDTAEDFARIEAIVGRMTRPHWTYGWREVLALNAEAEAAA